MDFQKKHEEINKIFSITPGNVYWKDREGKYLGCNDNQRAIAKVASVFDILGKTDCDLYGETLGNQVRAVDEEIMRTGLEKTFEEIGVDVVGERAIYATRKMPLFSERGEIIGIIGVSIDVTAQKIAQEQEQLALAQAAQEKITAKAEAELRQAIAVLAGSIAHDLRTPIATIGLIKHSLQRRMAAFQTYDAFVQASDLALPEAIATARATVDLTEETKSIERALESMRRCIDTTLALLSKTLRGELTTQDLTTCSMWSVIHNTLSRYPFADSWRELVCWDQTDFAFPGNEIFAIRIFSNLIKNSVEQIEKNKRGKIFIATEKGEQGNKIRFKDTAGGAPSEVMAHLFDGYHSTKETGTGIGLAFCKMAMESFGGDITCESVYGDYIEFTLTFPKIVETVQGYT